jgi:hypothetical protein
VADYACKVRLSATCRSPADATPHIRALFIENDEGDDDDMRKAFLVELWKLAEQASALTAL